MIVAAKSAKEIGDIISWINKKLHVARKQGEKLSINCLNSVGTYLISTEIDKGVKRKLGRKIKFNNDAIKDITVTGFPLLSEGSNAVIATTEGFEIDVSKLPDDCDKFIIGVEFRVSNKLINRFVERTYKIEPLKEEDEYWMHAAIKSPRLLQDIYNRGVDLTGVDVTVDVGIINDVKICVPKEVIKSLKITRQWIKEKERQKKEKLSWEHMKLQRGCGKKIEFKKIENLANYCSPSNFEKKFVMVEGPFKLEKCFSKKDYFEDIYFPTFPKVMGVVSRTDLNIENPAADGKLIYKKSEFKEGIVNMFA